MRQPRPFILLVGLLLLASAPVGAVEVGALFPRLVSGGGGVSRGEMVLRGSVGEIGAGRAENRRYSLRGGFHRLILPSGATAVEEGGSSPLPLRLSLDQNHPNPFNPTTTLRYRLPREGRVRLELFDTAGRCVRVLEDGLRSAGEHVLRVDGRGLASGVYLYRLRAAGQERTRRMVLLK